MNWDELARLERKRELFVHPCGGCGAQVGSVHDETCVHARCPECGAQLLGHDVHETDQGAVWYGIDPQTSVARDLGWWVEEADGRRVEDHKRVREAIKRGYVVWDSGAQRFGQAERITAVELPTALLKEALWTGCRGRYPEEAGIQLLVDTGIWLERADFRAGVEYERDEDPRRGQGVARVRWQQVADDVVAGRLRGEPGEVAVLLIAASLAGGVLIDLGQAFVEVRRLEIAPAVVAALESALV